MGNPDRVEYRLAGELLSRLAQMAILCSAGTESSESDLARRLADLGLPSDEDSVRAALHRMVQDGLLQASSRAGYAPCGSAYAITDEGRKAREGLVETSGTLRATLSLLSGGQPVPGSASALDAERAGLEAERREIERMRSDLLSTMSHELRTPLTLIRTSIGLLLDSEPDEAMRQRLLRNIKHSSERMHMLVTDLLDLVRLRSGHAELQVRYVEVGDLVSVAAGLMRPLMDQKEQALKVSLPSSPPRLMGDHRRLEQVLFNLLSNANKFSGTGARISIEVGDCEQTVVIAVADTGPGIPPEVQSRLFEQFYTARTSSLSHNIGAGLGLPIAKGIVEAHGGHIWVESTVGVGSTFYVSLPQGGPSPSKEASGENTGGG